MKKAKLIRILILIFALVLAVYLVASLMKQQIQREILFQTQPPNSNTNVPKSLTEYQACLDRANRSEAEQSIIDDSVRKCETLYKP